MFPGPPGKAIGIFIELLALKPGEKVMRNELLARHGYGRRAGVKMVLNVLCGDGPTAAHLREAGVELKLDEEHRAYFIKN